MALVVTVGAANANSYVSLAEALAYFDPEGHPSGAFWSQMEDARTEEGPQDKPSKEGALKRAARMMGRCRWQGCPVSAEQALAFPRVGVCRWEADKIPQAVKDAQCEQALFIARNWATGGQSKRAKLQAEGVQSYSLGEMSETYAANRIQFGAAAAPDLQLCDEARAILLGYLRSTGSVIR